MPGPFADDLTFYGIDGDECERFVAAVNKWAFEGDKDKDDEWVARFATSCIAGSAVRFYGTLDEDIQRSWRKLRLALLANYSALDPTIPRPAPVRLPKGGADELLVGMIRIFVEDEMKPRYLSHAIQYSGSHGHFDGKEDVSTALIVKLRRSGDLQPIRMANYPSWLGIAWHKPEARRAPVPQAWAVFACFWDQSSPVCRTYTGPLQWIIWKYDHSSKSLEIFWYEDGGDRIVRADIEVGISSSDELCVFASVIGYSADWKRLQRMEFVPI